MSLKALITIALRLYTIYLIVQSVFGFILALPVYGAISADLPAYDYFLIPGGMLLIAAVLWFCAFQLSAKVTKGFDTQLAFTTLSREDLYCFAFVFLGLYFGLSSIYASVQTGYQFFTLDFPEPVGSPQKGRYLVPFIGHALVTVAGFACIYGARRWSKKLIRLDNKNETQSPVA